jgi:hypothetical protein
VESTGDMTMKAVGLARNAGVVAKNPIVIAGKQYQPGDFIHMSVLDGMNIQPEKLKEMSPNFDFGGNGYWTIDAKTGKAIKGNALADRTVIYPMGKLSEGLLTEISTEGPHGILTAPAQFYRDMKLKTDVKKQIAHWKNTGATLMVERPISFTEEETGKYYDKASNQLGGGVYKHDQLSLIEERMNMNDTEKKLFRETIGSTPNATYNATNGVAIKPTVAKGAVATILAYRDGYVKKKWNMDPVLTPTKIVDSEGRIIPEYKQQTGWVEDKKGGATFYVNANVTGALATAGGYKSNGTQEFVNGSIALWKDKQTRSEGDKDVKAKDQSGATKTPTLPTGIKVQPIK